MGTRHLTCVYLDDEYKVAQYGQWDGYLRGQGITILRFVRGMNKEKFIDQLRNKVSWATSDEVNRQWLQCGADPDSEFVNMEVSDLHREKFPENSRDTGARILDLIMQTSNDLKLIDSHEFAEDGLFCEYNYVINLDTNTLEIYTSGRDHLVDYNLDDLPSDEEFLAIEIMGY